MISNAISRVIDPVSLNQCIAFFQRSSRKVAWFNCAIRFIGKAEVSVGIFFTPAAHSKLTTRDGRRPSVVGQLSVPVFTVGQLSVPFLGLAICFQPVALQWQRK